mmetsp:Transcript_41618/g.86958  ORF Transcript_41618/g.86958 Transcript_41618/m.86958 type:complete len:202 (-) Transcript_41618:924-1529(-)
MFREDKVKDDHPDKSYPEDTANTDSILLRQLRSDKCLLSRRNNYFRLSCHCQSGICQRHRKCTESRLSCPLLSGTCPPGRENNCFRSTSPNLFEISLVRTDYKLRRRRQLCSRNTFQGHRASSPYHQPCQALIDTCQDHIICTFYQIVCLLLTGMSLACIDCRFLAIQPQKLSKMSQLHTSCNQMNLSYLNPSETAQPSKD